MNQTSNVKVGDLRQITALELQVVIGIAERRIEDRYNIFYLQLSQSLRHNLRQMRQALAEPLGADTEPHVLLAEYMDREHRIVEAWNLHRFNGVIRYIPEEDVPDMLHNFPLRGAAHDMSTYRGYQFQMPARPLPRRINGIEEHEILTALDFLVQPDMQSIVWLGVLTLENIDNPPAPVVPEELPDPTTVTELETLIEGSGDGLLEEIENLYSAIEHVASNSTAIPLEDSVFETENELLKQTQDVVEFDQETIDKMLMEDLEKGSLSLAMQPYSDIQQDTTNTTLEFEEGTDNDHPNHKLVDAQDTQDQSVLDKEQGYANCESHDGTESSSSEIETYANEAGMSTRTDACGTVQKTEEEDAYLAYQEIKDVDADQEFEEADRTDQETEEGEANMANQDIQEEDVDMADTEDNCDAKSEDENDDTETSDGRKPSDIESDSDDIATPTQSKGDIIDGLSSDGQDERTETPEELEFEDDAVRLEELEQNYLWGETTEEETDGSGGDYVPDENSEDEEEGLPAKKRRL